MTDLDRNPASNQSDASGPKRLLRKLLHIPTPAIFAGCVVLAILVLWWQGGFADIISAMGQADIQPLLIAAPIYVASVSLLCLRWHLLVKMAQGWSDLPKASEAFLTSVVINYAAPVGLAVPSRAALTKRALGLDHGATGSIALWEIGADVLVLGAGTVLWLLLADGSTSAVGSELANSAGQYAKWGGVGLAIVGLALIWFLRTSEKRRKFVHLAQRILLAPKERPGQAAASVLVTAVYWTSQGVVLGILIHAFHVDFDPVLILGLTSMPILVGMLSPIPGGAVIREALMYVVARLAGAPAGDIVAAAVIYRIALFGAIPILYALARLWISRRNGQSPSATGSETKPVETAYTHLKGTPDR